MRAFARRITVFNCWLATAAGLLTALITVIVCVDVAARSAFRYSLPGASEVAILMLIALVFLGFAGAEAKGENFTVTILLQALGPRLRRVLEALAGAVSLLTVGLLTGWSWSRAIASTVSREASYGTIAFPVWPSKLLVALGLTMLALQVIAGLIDRAARRDDGPS